jgi:NTP pyrophosphatase (non-canonical NTP hydrolase)
MQEVGHLVLSLLRLEGAMSYKLDELADEIARQDHKHGLFAADTDYGKLRLAIACLEDEVVEARDAWREERRHSHWRHTREELLQVAAVAIRAVRLIDGGPPEEGMETRGYR